MKVNWMKPVDLHFHQKSAFVWFDFESSSQSGNIKTAHTQPALKTMSNTEEMYLFVIFFFFPVMISAGKSLAGLLLKWGGFLSSVRCMLGENDCVKHQTRGGCSRLMLLRLQDDAQAVTQLQFLKSEALWSKWATDENLIGNYVINLTIEGILNGHELWWL